jgi:hypothetical protein
MWQVLLWIEKDRDSSLLLQLRRGASLAWPRTQLPPNMRMPLEGVPGRCLDVEVVLERQTALISGLTLQSWSSAYGATAILYDWNSSQLEVRSHHFFAALCNAFLYKLISSEQCITPQSWYIRRFVRRSLQYHNDNSSRLSSQVCL